MVTRLSDGHEPSHDPSGGAHAVTAAGEEVEHRDPGEYLLDPNPAVARAGLVEDLARRLGVWKIDPRIAFLSSNELLRTPFARTLRALNIGSVDVRRRGLAGNIENLHSQLKLQGTRRATLVMTRVDNRPWALICVDPDSSPQDPAAPWECLA